MKNNRMTNKTIKIYLDKSIGNSYERVEEMDRIQELFGGNIVRKPNYFGYFFRTVIESMSDSGEIFDEPRISVETNRYATKEEFENELNSKLLTLKN